MQPDFEQFFLANYDALVRSLTAATGDRELARDSVQDAFVRASARWKKVSGYDNPVAWVRRVALNRSRDLIRSSRRRDARENAVATDPALGATAIGAGSHSASTLEGDMRVAELLGHLPAKQRTAAALYYVDDMPVDEIAYVMGISSGAVKFNLNRARTALRAVVESDLRVDRESEG